MATIRRVSGGGSALMNAINVAVGGDTILVEPGVYSPITCTKDGGSVTIIGADKNRCIVDGNGESYVYWKQSNWGRQHHFYNFTFRNGIAMKGPKTDDNYLGAIRGSGAARDTFTNCNIYGMKNNSILYMYDSNNAIVDRYHAGVFIYCGFYGCDIHDCECNGGLIFSSGSTSYAATCCEIHHNLMKCASSIDPASAHGIANYEGSFMLHSNVRCLIHHNVCYGDQSMIQGSTMVNSVVAFNSAYANPDKNNYVCHSLIYRPGNSNAEWWKSGSRMMGCVIYGNTGFNRIISANGSSITPKMANCALANNSPVLPTSDNTRIIWAYPQGSIHNCVFDTPKNQSYAQCNNASFDAADNLFDVADMGFIDPANMNFKLKSDSVLIGKGAAKYLQSGCEDLAGNPFKNVPAVGPYEFYEKNSVWRMPNYMQPFGGMNQTGCED